MTKQLIEIFNPSLQTHSLDWRSPQGEPSEMAPEGRSADPFPDFLEERHHHIYGRPWFVGRNYFDSLISNGVFPSHNVLDFGCGSGRVGIWLIPYLKTGNYTGIDRSWTGLRAFAEYEIPLHGLEGFHPRLVLDDSLKIEKLGCIYDVILDFYVSIHLSYEQRKVLYASFSDCLELGGRIFVPHTPHLTNQELSDIGLELFHVEKVEQSKIAGYLKKSKRKDHWHILIKREKVENTGKGDDGATSFQTGGVLSDALAEKENDPPLDLGKSRKDRGDRKKIFLKSIKDNIDIVMAYSLSNILFAASSLMFTASLGMYLGLSAEGYFIHDFFQNFERVDLILIAIISLFVALAAQFTGLFLKARTVVNQEKSLAEELRISDVVPERLSGVSRASNYFGRLSAASMNAVSSGITIFISVLVASFLLPNMLFVGLLVVLSICAVAMYGVMRVLYFSMEGSVRNMLDLARGVSKWKMGNDGEEGAADNVKLYYKSYFRRIFLSNAYSYAALIFSILATLIILVLRELYNFNFNFGEVFVVFMIMQIFLRLIGAGYNSILQTAAFIHVLLPYLGNGYGGAQSEMLENLDEYI